MLFSYLVYLTNESFFWGGGGGGISSAASLVLHFHGKILFFWSGFCESFK